MADGPGQSVGLHFVADRPEPINNVPHHHHPKSVRDHVLVEPNQPPKDGYPSLVNFLNTGLPAAVDHKSSTGSGVGLSSAPNGDAIVTNEFQKRSSQSTSHYQNESVIPEPSTAWRRPTPLAIATHNVSPASQRINGVKLPSPTQHSHSQWKSPSTHPPPMSAPPFFHPQAAHHPGPYHASSYGHNPAHDEIANQMTLAMLRGLTQQALL
ncbi:hypothetical protein BJ742DRAFT_249716 [Cladochytrium replicatum]|nr:hypothetical protein BJ742DRAFT_249716 [Cladochytrium replicatum]